MLTLFTTPVIYLYLDRAHHWYVRRKAARSQQAIPDTPAGAIAE
jgi:HAE1 family hydrophobic/amphiphilic exporter-1